MPDFDEDNEPNHSVAPPEPGLPHLEADMHDTVRVEAANAFAAPEYQSQGLVGNLIADRYELLSFIGQGGMSAVYKAQDRKNGKIVAVKLLLPHLVTDAVSFARFQLEAKAASSLSHPNIVHIFDFGATQDGRPYIVMDYLDGTGLHDAIKALRVLPVERSILIFSQIADALQSAHERGILHRDLKPSNILLLHQGPFHDFVKIVDFGIAKVLPQEGGESLHLTKTGEVFGSPFYMSPEQCRGEKVDARSDIYSMGCLMYEVLSGSPPLIGNNLMETLLKHLSETPASFAQSVPDSKIPEQLEKIVFKSLHKDPEQRYASMAALKKDLNSFLEQTDAGWITLARLRLELFTLKFVPFMGRERVLLACCIAITLMTIGLLALVANIYFDSDATGQPPGPGSAWEFKIPERSNEQKTFAADAKVAKQILLGYENSLRRGSFGHLRTLQKFAELNEKNGHLAGAADAYRKLYEYNRDLDGPTTIQTVQSLSNYADCLLRAGETVEAEARYKELMRISSLKVTNPPREYFSAAKKLADTEMQLHKYTQAQGLYELVLKNMVDTGQHKDDQKTYATVLSRLADCFRLSGYHERAVQTYEKALTVWKEIKKPTDPEVFGVDRFMAFCHYQLGHYKRARYLYEPAIEAMEAYLGDSDQEMLSALREYKEMMWKKGNYLKALQAQWKLRGLETRRKTTSARAQKTSWESTVARIRQG